MLHRTKAQAWDHGTQPVKAGKMAVQRYLSHKKPVKPLIAINSSHDNSNHF